MTTTVNIPALKSPSGKARSGMLRVSIVDSQVAPFVVCTAFRVSDGTLIDPVEGIHLTGESQELELEPQANIAIDAEGSQSWYLFEIMSVADDQRFVVAVPDQESVDLIDLVGAAGIDPSSILDGRLLTTDERAGIDAGTAITADNPPLTQDDLSAAVAAYLSSLRVDPPAQSNSPGAANQWAYDGTYYYKYFADEEQWGRFLDQQVWEPA